MDELQNKYEYEYHFFTIIGNSIIESKIIFRQKIFKIQKNLRIGKFSK